MLPHKRSLLVPWAFFYSLFHGHFTDTISFHWLVTSRCVDTAKYEMPRTISYFGVSTPVTGTFSDFSSCLSAFSVRQLARYSVYRTRDKDWDTSVSRHLSTRCETPRLWVQV